MKCSGCGYYITKFKQERGAYRQIEVNGKTLYFHVKCFLKGGYKNEN